eukprot:gnl/Hemi2/9317_TR3248_c0_g1_i1.p1 gnl/Hemi2/9317_TR3248_c0_g1~~gnl/Hemi2/9317_TR3248_c0_g1_i1.p1  ORF type:complete len:215 (-),score=76.42 gnl/Hemi2/9317_TR3248_c0_g1_i1:175-819(-)
MHGLGCAAAGVARKSLGGHIFQNFSTTSSSVLPFLSQEEKREQAEQQSKWFAASSDGLFTSPAKAQKRAFNLTLITNSPTNSPPSSPPRSRPRVSDGGFVAPSLATARRNAESMEWIRGGSLLSVGPTQPPASPRRSFSPTLNKGCAEALNFLRMSFMAPPSAAAAAAAAAPEPQQASMNEDDFAASCLLFDDSPYFPDCEMAQQFKALGMSYY